MDYVAGFLFNADRTEVLLIQKSHPDWQNGKLNGVGGKVEKGERPSDAMAREFQEETGVAYDGWRNFCMLCGNWGRVSFFVGHMDDEGDIQQFHGVESTDGETLVVALVACLRDYDVISNLLWLVPMALDDWEVVAMVMEGVPL